MVQTVLQLSLSITPDHSPYFSSDSLRSYLPPHPLQWVPPPGWTDAPSAAAPATSASSGGGDLGEWAEHQDPESGLPYYYNARTQESRWDRPS